MDAYKTNSVVGIGLGLRVWRLLVEAIGGYIRIESESGKGRLSSSLCLRRTVTTRSEARFPGCPPVSSR